jgi:DNA-directed RNA polymerase specialized sigma24 family protein
VTPAEEFIEFAAVTSPRLRRTAFLLCGDWHTAEDLAQTTLTKVFGSWRRISRKDAADAYAARTLVNTPTSRTGAASVSARFSPAHCPNVRSRRRRPRRGWWC